MNAATLQTLAPSGTGSASPREAAEAGAFPTPLAEHFSAARRGEMPDARIAAVVEEYRPLALAQLNTLMEGHHTPERSKGRALAAIHNMLRTAAGMADAAAAVRNTR